MHVVGTAGHVDHGKSALVQRLTGIDPDRFAEEKERGLTIDLGFAWLAMPSGAEVGIIDVPGHERFIKNMLAGAGGIDACLFVVAANEGWMPQSSEHLAIVDILGISSGVVALTKSDLVSPAELVAVEETVRARISGSSLEGAEIVACSSVGGSGIPELVAALDHVLSGAAPAPDLGRPRLWVDRVFTIAGAGTVVTGTLAGGSLSVGDQVEVSPEGRMARVRTIQSHNKEVRTIGPGNRTALNLAGLERQGAQRGDAIVSHGQFRITRRIDVELRAAAGAPGIVEKGAHLLYVGAAEVAVRVRLAGTDRIEPGSVGFAQLQLQDPLPLQRGDRFVLRDAGRVVTLGGGRVLDPLPPPARRNDASRLALMDSLAGEASALGALVGAAGRLDRSEALYRAGVPDVGGAGVIELGSLLVSPSEFDRLTELLTKILAEHHADHPLDKGVAREVARAGVGLPPDAFEALVGHVPDVVEEGALVRLAAHRVALDAQQEAARARLLATIDAGGFAPPLTEDLRADEALLRTLVDNRELVKIGDFHLTGGLAAEARSRVRGRIEDEGPVTVAQIRDLLGTTRKYAVPLCEWLDATGATRRQGDHRTLGPNP